MIGQNSFDFSQIIIPAAAALLGVLVGGLITFNAQRMQRRHDHAKRQLECFYGPLIAMRRQILSKSELRVKLHAQTNAAWQKRIESAQGDPLTLKRVEDARGPQFDKVFNYSEEQFTTEIIPLYQKMLEFFTQHMWLAEPSTIDHFSALVEFIEIWNRYLAKTIPHEVVETIGHSEKSLYPFYEDLEAHTKRLRKELRK
jgi:hypothetical protein